MSKLRSAQDLLRDDIGYKRIAYVDRGWIELRGVRTLGWVSPDGERFDCFDTETGEFFSFNSFDALENILKTKITVEEQIEDFLEKWDADSLVGFLREIGALMALYNVDETDDWVRDVLETTDNEEVRIVRLIRTVYLISRISEFYAGKLCTMKVSHPNLWKKLEARMTSVTS